MVIHRAKKALDVKDAFDLDTARENNQAQIIQPDICTFLDGGDVALLFSLFILFPGEPSPVVEVMADDEGPAVALSFSPAAFLLPALKQSDCVRILKNLDSFHASCYGSKMHREATKNKAVS